MAFFFLLAISVAPQLTCDSHTSAWSGDLSRAWVTEKRWLQHHSQSLDASSRAMCHNQSEQCLEVFAKRKRRTELHITTFDALVKEIETGNIFFLSLGGQNISITGSVCWQHCT